MDHNGLYTDLDSFSSITNNSFNDTCPTLPSLNNFKYQQTNLSSNIYQQHDQQQHNHSAKSSLPQININNCNNNIFFPHDDGIFDANTTATTQCATANNQKNNFIGYIRKETGASGGGGDNITYNINNINTNIVNGGSDIFGGNQYHQINKNGETIINFTNNNLNGSGSSMPSDTVAATSQNFYGYQTNSNVQGQQTVYETSVQSQSSTFLDPKNNMGTTNTGLYHGHPNPANQVMTNGGFLPGNGSTDHSSTGDLFSEYTDPLSTAKIITNFESKNPLKYPNKPVGSYYKGAGEYQYPPIPMGHLPPHNYPPGLYQHSVKIPPAHSYEPYPRISPRNNVPHYPTQPYPNAHAMDVSYSRSPSVSHPQYHLPPHPSHPPNNYGNFYNNTYSAMPYPSYPQMPYSSPLLRNESCSKSTSNYSKTGAVAMSPVEHNTFSMAHPGSYPASKKDFYNEFYPPQHFFEEQSAMNSCAKKASRTKVNPEIYNPNGATMYPDPHTISHHPQNGNVMRNMAYQPMPKHCSSYPMPSNSIDSYHNSYFYPYKNGEHPKVQKVNPAMSSKQFKNYSHFEQLPPHQQLGHYGHSPQYHTMQAKPPEKIKISIDLEEQINCSKIPKMTAYGYDPHHHFYQYHHHHMPPRNIVNDIDPTKNPIANINISLRDFLSTWNEIDDDEETRQPTEDMERAIMREYNPMFVQKVSETFTVVPPKPTELESGIINEGSEKLYVLESIDVPLSELNKYKHLSVINKLPENVVINDKELYADVDGSMKFIEEIDLAREKLYKSEFELEFEACQERKIHKIEEVQKAPESLRIPETLKAPIVPKIEKLGSFENETKVVESEKVENEKERIPERRKSVAQVLKAEKHLKSSKKSLEKLPKTQKTILKLKKEKILKASKVRITKRLKKYALNQRTSSVKSLQSICVDLINTSSYRKFAREQSKIIEKVSKMRILKDIKKKFNFEGMKRTNPLINQKSNHSVQINSLREICGNLLKDREIDENESEKSSYEDEIFPTLSTATLNEMNIDVVQDDFLFSPTSLKDMCETFIYSNPSYFHIEEVSNVPKLQDLCKAVLSETNIFINIEENEEMFSLNDEPEEDLETHSFVDNADDEPIYIIEENSGNVGELFESKNLNSFERSEILRKIQRVASIEDDEIFQAIGALHECDESIINNNDSNVSNKNIHGNGNFSTTNELFALEKPEMSPYLSYMDDDLMHSVQYEEIVSEGGDGSLRNIVEILRHKYLNRCDERQTLKIVGKIIKKALTYQRSHRFLNANRRHRIDYLKKKAEAARVALQKQKHPKFCDTFSPETTSSTSEQSENESQTDAKDHKKAQTHQKVDDSHTDNCFEMIDSEAERNFPRLSSVLPSINEYKIDRKGSNRSDVKDICVVKKQKMTFDESLLSIDKIYVENSENGNVHRKSSLHSNRHKNRHHDERKHQSSHHISRHHSRSRENTRKSYHSSSRQNFYTKDQIQHSEAKRLVIPSYKLYDKDLDIKLKTMPYVRIERVEKVDDMVKKYN